MVRKHCVFNPNGNWNLNTAAFVFILLNAIHLHALEILCKVNSNLSCQSHGVSAFALGHCSKEDHLKLSLLCYPSQAKLVGPSFYHIFDDSWIHFMNMKVEGIMSKLDQWMGTFFWKIMLWEENGCNIVRRWKIDIKNGCVVKKW